MNEFEKLKKEGNENYKKKNFEEALKLYDKCIELQNDNLLVRNNKAAVYIQMKELDKAMEIVEEAIKIYNEKDFSKRSFENYAKVLARKARIYYLKKDLDKAIEWYENSLLENRVNKVSSTLRQIKREKKHQEE